MTEAATLPEREQRDRRQDHAAQRPLVRHDARDITRPTIQWMNFGWVCVASALALSLLGMLAIDTTEPQLAIRQAVYLGIGVFSALVVTFPSSTVLRRCSYPMLIVVIALLVFLLLPGVPEWIVRPRNGARRWINLYVTDFQPSELAKVAFVLVLANYLRLRENHRRFLGLIPPFALTFVPMGLILVEPDLGTSLLFLPTLFTMLIAAGARIRHFVLIFVLGLALAPSMYPLLKPHQKDRIHAMIGQIAGDTSRNDNIGFQGDRAMTLIGAGGLHGVGRDHARDLIRYNRLPEEHNDMIFAVIVCRWGLVGGIAVLGLFLVYLVGGVLTAALCRDPFGRLVVVGLVTMVAAQMTINIGMTVGLLPITGMTLPFVSYGGSSLVANWLMTGVLLSIALRRPRRIERHTFEFDDEESH